MKLMKNLLAALVALVLAVGAMTTASAASGDWVEFEPQLCNIFDLPVSEWMANDTNKALATVCIWLDIATSDTFVGDIKIYENSYIGHSDNLIFISLQLADKSNALYVSYHPAEGTARYRLFPIIDSFDQQMEYIMSATCTNGLYINSYSAIADVISMLSEALSD